jgi:hypothetical protein
MLLCIVSKNMMDELRLTITSATEGQPLHVLQATWLVQLLPSRQQLDWNDYHSAAAAVARMVTIMVTMLR